MNSAALPELVTQDGGKPWASESPSPVSSLGRRSGPRTPRAAQLTAFRTFGDRLSGTAEEIVQAMFDDIAVSSTRPDFAGTGFTRFVIELADLPGHPARVIARRHKALLETQLAAVLKRAKVPLAERRARELMLLSEGAVVMLLIHRDRDYVAAAANVAKQLVQQRRRSTRRR
jgi:hypothetical protein